MSTRASGHRAPRMVTVAALSAFAAGLSCAATFDVPRLTERIDARITLNCDKTTCRGPGSLNLFTRPGGRFLQSLPIEESSIEQAATSRKRLSPQAAGLVAGDFNFDREVDLAVFSGNHGSYGGPSYDVYVFNRTRQAFVLSQELTALAADSLGLFELDEARKRLVTHEKSGCCWHKQTAWKVVPHHGLQDVWSKEEAATADGRVVVTVRERVDGRWREQVHTYPIDAYYKGKQ